MQTALEFYNELKNKLSFLGEDKRIKDDEIRLLEPQTLILRRLFLSWAKNMTEETVKTLIINILQKPDVENGKVYEALVYAWLENQGILYNPQFHIAQEDCLKASDKGYDADGIIIENNIIFDVKQFGLTLPHIETLRRKLQSMIPEDYYLTIEGGRNISVKDLQINFLEKINDIAQCIMNEKNKNHTDYLYREDKFGLEFRAWSRRENSVFTSISEFDRYEWAANNEFYFMHHASQFCINSPYILFCPYDKQLAPIFSNEDRSFTFLAFRALCRRVFMNLIKMDERKINSFDGKARNDISVATATKKISAIVFIDVSDEFDYLHCRTFVFQNPNADYKIPRYQIDKLFRYAGAIIEDFRFDNY